MPDASVLFSFVKVDARNGGLKQLQQCGDGLP